MNIVGTADQTELVALSACGTQACGCDKRLTERVCAHLLRQQQPQPIEWPAGLGHGV